MSNCYFFRINVTTAFFLFIFQTSRETDRNRTLLGAAEIGRNTGERTPQKNTVNDAGSTPRGNEQLLSCNRDRI